MDKDAIKAKIIGVLLIACVVLVFCLTTVLNSKRDLTRQISSLSTQVEELQEDLKDTKYQNSKLKYELNGNNIVVDYVYSSEKLKDNKDLNIEFFVTQDVPSGLYDVMYYPTTNPEQFTSLVNNPRLCFLVLTLRNYTTSGIRLSYQFNNQSVVYFDEQHCGPDSFVTNKLKTRSLPDSTFGNDTKTVYTITLYFSEY